MKITKIKFKNPEKVSNWISKNLVQGDPRYEAWPEEEEWLTYFIFNMAIIIKEQDIPNLKEPGIQELQQIGGPQEVYKYIASELLQQKGIKKENIKFEYQFGTRRLDVFAKKNHKKFLVECCSCYIKKLIQYLDDKNVELWVITYGYSPWETVPYLEKSKWFIIKRGPRWDGTYKKYNDHWKERLKKIKSPIDTIFGK